MDNLEKKENTFLSYEEFKRKVLECSEGKTVTDKVADIYDDLPVLVRVIANLDPTGLASSLDQVLTENKAKREQENILRAIYALYTALITFQSLFFHRQQDIPAEIWERQAFK